jgi:AcrR family transcriptional regulator
VETIHRAFGSKAALVKAVVEAAVARALPQLARRCARSGAPARPRG